MDKTQLIYKVLSGEGSAGEEKELKRWRTIHNDNEVEYESIRLMWVGSRSFHEYSKDDPFYDGFRNIKARIKRKVKQRRLTYIISFLIAITFLLLALHYLISVKHDAGYQRNMLTFNQATLSEVVSTLENRFHVTITVPEAAGNCRFTGSFLQDSPSETIRLISESMGLRCVRVNDEHFRLEGSGCNSLSVP